MVNENDNSVEMPQDDSSLSLDEMLGQIIDEDVEVVDESQTPEPEVDLDDLIDEPVEDQTDLPDESANEDLEKQDDESSTEPAQSPDMADNLNDESIGALLSEGAVPSPEEEAAKQKRRQLLWVVFGIACILAIALPATFVFLKARSIASNTPDNQTTIKPVNDGNATVKSIEATSSETTKTASTVTEDDSATSDSTSYKEVDLEEWNYYVHGYNIFAPARGPRVKDAASQINENYKTTVYDALDILINEANGVQITIPDFTDTVKTDATGSNSSSNSSPQVDTGSGSTSKPPSKTRMYLDAIGSSSTNKVAIWYVGKTSYQTVVGDKIGSTGWKVTRITSTTATIKNGSKTYTLRVGGYAIK